MRVPSYLPVHTDSHCYSSHSPGGIGPYGGIHYKEQSQSAHKSALASWTTLGLLAHVLAFDHVDVVRWRLNVKVYKHCLIMSWLVGDCQEVRENCTRGCLNVKVCRDHCIRYGCWTVRWLLITSGSMLEMASFPSVNGKGWLSHCLFSTQSRNVALISSCSLFYSLFFFLSPYVELMSI